MSCREVREKLEGTTEIFGREAVVYGLVERLASKKRMIL